MVTVFIRTILVYLLLVLMMRLMGKRQIGELEVSELITTLLLSEVASLPLTDHDIPVMFAVIPIVTLVAIEIFTSVLLIKFPSLKNLLSPRPNVLIDKGRLCESELRRLRMSTDELISELRQAGLTSIDEVYYAIVEENGKLSVIPKSAYRPLTPSDMKIKVTEIGISHTLISDGKIDRHGLISAGIDDKTLENCLSRRNCRVSDVFLMLRDDSGAYTVILKEKKK